MCRAEIEAAVCHVRRRSEGDHPRTPSHTVFHLLESHEHTCPGNGRARAMGAPCHPPDIDVAPVDGHGPAVATETLGPYGIDVDCPPLRERKRGRRGLLTHGDASHSPQDLSSTCQPTLPLGATDEIRFAKIQAMAIAKREAPWLAEELVTQAAISAARRVALCGTHVAIDIPRCVRRPLH
jgi:hypothetical protein